MIFHLDADQASIETLDPQEAYLLIKDDLYEKSGRLGYTTNLLEAGWFIQDFAQGIANKDSQRLSMSLKSELAKKGVDVRKIKFWQKRLDRLLILSIESEFL